MLINQELRLRAHQIELKNGTIQNASGIDRITCKSCKNEEPLWYFNASSANRDMKTKTLFIVM